MSTTFFLGYGFSLDIDAILVRLRAHRLPEVADQVFAVCVTCW